MTIAIDWRPHAGQQTRFLSSSAFEALFGGAAGPGKTECLIMEALRQVDNPRYTGIIFRRIFPSLEAARGIIQRSLEWYPVYKGRYNSQKHYWTFPSGSRIYFGHMQHEDDMLQYQGSEYAYVGFDELTEFTERQYLYMFTRCRVTPGSGLRAYVRSATNPGNLGHQWVKRRFITTDIMNRVGYFAPVNGKDARVEKDTPDAMSRAFYPGKLDDNPSADPNYAMRIRATGDPIQVARLIGGNWDAEYTEGVIFDNWSSLLNVSQDAEYNPDLPVNWYVDDGYATGAGPGTESYHPRVILFAQETPVGGVNIFDEYYAVGELSEVSIANALARPYRRPEVAYCDSSAAELRGRIWSEGVMTVAATHPVHEGIKVLRRMICDGNGMRLFRSHTRCEQFNHEITSYRRDERSRVAHIGEPEPLKIDDHGPSAARYGVWHLRFSE
jgi:hypothetical protein